jgi:SAM-dependent methyltransferase
MAQQSSEDFLRPYRQAVSRHGAGFAATLWGSREAQIRRFDVFIDLAGFEDCAVLDAGCGPGDFAVRLVERDVPFARFIGIDAVAEMVDKARELGLPRCTFEVRDIVSDDAALRLGDPDFVCISGSLNTMPDEAARAVVRAGFEAATQGVLFNFLSDRARPDRLARPVEPARRFDTIAWIDWALTLSPCVSFTQDYLDGHDATIMVRR